MHNLVTFVTITKQSLIILISVRLKNNISVFVNISQSHLAY